MILLFLLLWGLFAGWLAHLLLGGTARSGDWTQLLIAGLLGSFVGGLLINVLSGDGLALRPSGLIGSVVGAMIVLAVAGYWQRRG